MRYINFKINFLTFNLDDHVIGANCVELDDLHQCPSAALESGSEVKSHDVAKQRMLLTLKYCVDVRKTGWCGNHHVPDSVIPLYV